MLLMGPPAMVLGGATRQLLLGSLLLEKHTVITLSFPATQHAMSYYVPVTEHVMMDDWIAFGAAVWMKVEKLCCMKGLGNCDSHGCRGPKGQLWCCEDGKIYVQSLLFLHARTRAHCSDDQRPCGPTQCGASGANLFAAHSI